MAMAIEQDLPQIRLILWCTCHLRLKFDLARFFRETFHFSIFIYRASTDSDLRSRMPLLSLVSKSPLWFCSEESTAHTKGATAVPPPILVFNQITTIHLETHPIGR